MNSQGRTGHMQRVQRLGFPTSELRQLESQKAQSMRPDGHWFICKGVGLPPLNPSQRVTCVERALTYAERT